MVSCVLVQGTIADYGEWKGFFNTKGAALRGANGSRGGRIFRSGDNPNKVHVLLSGRPPRGRETSSRRCVIRQMKCGRR